MLPPPIDHVFKPLHAALLALSLLALSLLALSLLAVPTNAIAQYAKLLPNAEELVGGEFFGASVALGDGLGFVGYSRSYVEAPTPGTFSAAGSVYVFDEASGLRLRRLVADDAMANDRFGSAVATNDGIALIGARGDDSQRGAAYLFDPFTGEQLIKLVADDRDLLGGFGSSVSISGGLALVGAPGSRAAYLFDIATGSQARKLVSTDTPPFEFGFGASTAIDDGIALVGAPRGYLNGEEAGVAYIFDTATGDQLHRLVPDDPSNSINSGQVCRSTKDSRW